MSRPTVRAKFVCREIEDYGTTKKIILSAVGVHDRCPGENADNAIFNKWTPSGELWMSVDNPKASVQFEKGRAYYLDFTPAD